jgi:hypothetical protein
VRSALEDGQVVFEDAEVDTGEPTFHRLAKWCEKNTKVAPKPPVKAGPVRDYERLPLRRSANR